MRVLAIETATPVASVALVDAAGVAASRTLRAPMRHLEWVAAAIDGMLRDLGWGPEAVDAVASGRGPGGFTGLRIGIATAAAWARARHTPLLGVDTLETLACSAAAGGLVVPVLDAHRGEVAAALYRCAPPFEPVCLLPAVVAVPDVVVAEIRGTLQAEGAVPDGLVVAGAGLARYREQLAALLGAAGVRQVIERPDAHPRAETAGLLARRRLLRGVRDEAARLLPAYGRRPVARLWQETSPRPGSGG